MEESYYIPQNQIIKIPAANHLTDATYRILISIHAKHSSSMGLDQRLKYRLSDIVKVEVNVKENCLNVYYSSGDWWHYRMDGTWH